jgi:hypothetical protein
MGAFGSAGLLVIFVVRIVPWPGVIERDLGYCGFTTQRWDVAKAISAWESGKLAETESVNSSLLGVGLRRTMSKQPIDPQ